jgi:hypothetical protein
MTVTRCAREYGITARPAGITSHPQMVTKLASTPHRDIRRAVEGGLHGWQRLHRFQAVMTFPTIDTAADHLGIDQSTLVRQPTTRIRHRRHPLPPRQHSSRHAPHPPRHCAAPRALDHPAAQQHLAIATKRGTKASDQLPRKEAPPGVINYHRAAGWNYAKVLSS